MTRSNSASVIMRPRFRQESSVGLEIRRSFATLTVLPIAAIASSIGLADREFPFVITKTYCKVD
jgi:hypothetical protein